MTSTRARERKRANKNDISQVWQTMRNWKYLPNSLLKERRKRENFWRNSLVRNELIWEIVIYLFISWWYRTYYYFSRYFLSDKIIMYMYKEKTIRRPLKGTCLDCLDCSVATIDTRGSKMHKKMVKGRMKKRALLLAKLRNLSKLRKHIVGTISIYRQINWDYCIYITWQLLGLSVYAHIIIAIKYAVRYTLMSIKSKSIVKSEDTSARVKCQTRRERTKVCHPYTYLIWCIRIWFYSRGGPVVRTWCGELCGELYKERIPGVLVSYSGGTDISTRRPSEKSSFW